jgi:hypothetical protein
MPHRMLALIALATLTACSSAHSGRLQLPDYSHLARKASDSNTVSLSGSLLRFAASMSDDAEAQDWAAALDGIHVRSFEFATDGAYSDEDLEAVRRQLTGPKWSQIAKVRSRKQGEQVDVFVSLDGDRARGIAVIVAEPRELTIVNISGDLQLEKLRKLEGHFGIPHLDADH